jgi:glycosyltransferase involved in cell wall biosynthesis
MSLSSLIVMQWETNVGYAIGPLERLFYDVALELAEGDARKVHFAYRDLSGGAPMSLPGAFQNVIAYDFAGAGPADHGRLAAYASDHGIGLALFFDIDFVHPVFFRLRKAGVRTLLGYCGAPVSGLMPAWRLALRRLAIGASRSKLDAMIFESRAMAELGEFGRGIPRESIEVTPPGVDIERFHPGPSVHAHDVFQVPRASRLIIYSGHIQERKGVHVLVAAARQLLESGRQDVWFLICGNRPGESEPFEKQLHSSPAAQWVKFGGYRSDMAELYRSAFCGVLPSTGWDSFTLSAVEMAACGLPVVASRLQGLQEAVLDGVTGLLFQPGDASGLRACLERLLDSPAEAKALGHAGRVRCESELNLDSHRRRFLKIVRNRIARRSPAEL